MYYLPFVLLKKIFWNIVHVKCSTKRDYRDESWKHITFHRSTCGAMFFTMFCMDRVEGGKINRKVREREKKKSTERKYRGGQDIYRSLLEQKAGTTLSILNWIVEKRLLLLHARVSQCRKRYSIT